MADKFVRKFPPISDEERAKLDRAILAEYSRLGLSPVYAGDMLVSPALSKQISDRRGAQ